MRRMLLPAGARALRGSPGMPIITLTEDKMLEGRHMPDAFLECFSRARRFVYRNARPLDLARFHFHFEHGGAEAVLAALSAYQNADGGFGHALEPDAWNPASAPIQTWAATEVLRELGFFDSAHPLVAGILRYLESGRDFDGHTWANTIHSNADHPHAPWWAADSQSASHHT